MPFLNNLSLLESGYTEIENTLRLLHHILNDSEIKKVVKQSRRAATSKDYYHQHNRLTVSRPAGLADTLDGYRKKDLTIIPKLIAEVYDIVTSGKAYKLNVSASELNLIMRAATIINANEYAITTERQCEKLRTLISVEYPASLLRGWKTSPRTVNNNTIYQFRFRFVNFCSN